MRLQFILFVLFFSAVFGGFAQEKKPKIALVLSGGGAKGIAHIPVLQKLDSLGIVPDLVVGTSMGSVVGSLYAAGYSGDSIAKITKTVEWEKILGGNVSLLDVGVEEKSEFERYIVNIDVDGGKPKIKASLLKDQNLREFLTALLYPVLDIRDFDDLPIPFRSVTTDLVKGKEVVLSEGSLSLAVRASMSIPSVFEPVKYKETLLVDGGVLNNFPTDVAKQLGADIIIGSDVGGGMAPIEDLNSITTILFQTSMMNSNLKNPENQALCDILIDHFPNLTYSTGDFLKSKEIYNQGLIATNENINKLAAIAETLKKFPQRDPSLPKIDGNILFNDIKYEGISPENLSLVKARMSIKPNTNYNSSELKQAIDRAMGTELFYQITYKVDINEQQKILVLTGQEKARNQISGALHYDTQQGVGLILNYTGRNIFGYSSRMLVGLDIAEQPKYRVEYQQSVGDSKKWWWRTHIYGQNAIQRYYTEGNIGEDLKNRYFKANIQLNKDLDPFFNYIGLDFNYERVRTKPRLNPDVNTNIYDLRRYKSKNLEVSAYYVHNSMNKVFFPNKGITLKARLSRSLYHSVDVEFDEGFENNVSDQTNGFSKFTFELEKRWPVKQNLALIVGGATGLIFIDRESSNRPSFIEYGPGAQFTIGGHLPSNVRGSFLFNGLEDSELNVTQFLKAHFGIQYNPMRNIYITPYMNLASVGFDDTNDFFNSFFQPDGKWTDTTKTSALISLGSTISYNSILGPVNFDISYVNQVNEIPLFFSVGLQLNVPQ